MKWIDHNEIDIIPMDIYIGFLNDNIIPTSNPIVKVIIIILLNLLGKNNILSGFNIHRSKDPRRIAIGAMIIKGKFE